MKAHLRISSQDYKLDTICNLKIINNKYILTIIELSRIIEYSLEDDILYFESTGETTDEFTFSLDKKTEGKVTDNDGFIFLVELVTNKLVVSNLGLLLDYNLYSDSNLITNTKIYIKILN